MKRRRALTWLGRVLAGLAAALLVAATGATLIARTEWGRARIARALEEELSRGLRGGVKIGRVSGALPRELVLEGVEIRDGEGRVALAARRLRLALSLGGLLRRRLVLREAEAEGGLVVARRLGDGKWNLAQLGRGGPEKGRRWTIVVRRAKGEGRVVVERAGGRIEAGVEIAGGARIGGAADFIEVERLRARVERPGGATIEARGRVGLAPPIGFEGVRVAIDSDGEELARFFPGVELSGPIGAVIEGEGKLDRLAGKARIGVAGGEVTVEGKLEGGMARAQLSGSGLDLGAWRGAPRVRIAVEGEVRGAVGGRMVEIESLAVSGARVRVSATGRVSTGGAVALRGRVVAADLARLEVLGIRGLAGRAAGRFALRRSARAIDFDATVTGRRVSAAGVRAKEVRIEGHADGKRGCVMVDGRAVEVAGRRIDRVRVDAAGGPGGAVAGLDAVGQGARVVLEARARPEGVGGSWGAWREGAVGRIGRLLIGQEGAGGWRLAGEAPFAVSKQRWRLGPLALATGGGYAVVRAEVERGEIEGEIAISRVDVGAVARALWPQRRWVPAIVDGKVRLSGPLGEVRAEGKLDGEVRPHGKPAIAVGLAGRWERGRLAARLEAGVGKARPVRAEGEVALPWLEAAPLSLRVIGRALPLGWIGAWVPGAVGLAGEATIDARVEGTGERPSVAGELDAAWRFAGVAGRLAGRWRAGEGRSEISFDAAGEGAGSVAVRASVGLSPRELLARGLDGRAEVSGSLALSGVELGRLPWPRATPAWLSQNGRVDARVEVGGTIAAPKVSGEGRVQNLHMGGIGPATVSARATVGSDETEIDGSVAVRGGELAVVKGRVGVGTGALSGGRRDGPLQLEARLRGFDLARLRGIRPALETLAGRLTGRVVAGGTLARPRIEGDLAVGGLGLAAVRFERVAARTTFADGVAGWSLDAPLQGGGGVKSDGKVAVDRQGPLAVGVVVSGLDLGFVSALTDAFGQARGRVEARLSIQGTRAQPRAEGTLKLVDGKLSTEIGSFRGITLDARLAAGRFKLEQLTAQSGRGTIRITGDADLTGWRPTRVDLGAKADKFAVAAGGVGAAIDGRLKLHATQVPEGLTGKITVEEGVIHLPQLGAGRSLQPIGPLEDVVFVDSAARRKAARAKGAGLEGMVSLVVPGDFALRGKEVNAVLRGSLQVKLDAGRAVLSGEVSTPGSGGWVEILGRRFTIDHGRFGFSGEQPIDPVLDVRLTRQLTDAALVVDVTGSARHPHIELSSDPPIYDSSQVLGLIVSGDPTGRAVSQRSLDQKIVGALSGVIVSKLSQSLLPGLPVDVLRIDVGAQGFGGLATTRLEVGKYVTDDVYVSYVHQFGLISPLQRINPNQATVQWRFSRHLQLETTFGDAGIGGADLFFTLRF